jgi:predicted nucleic acid-binding protein
LKIADIRATTVTVPLEAPLQHASGAHWGRFVRTIVEVETDEGLVGFEYEGGSIKVPDGPGLGVSLDRDKLDEYTELYKELGGYQAAEEWGRMNVPDPISIIDGLMAATAKVRNMTFVTRNTADVARTGVRLLNPFDASE